MMSISEGAPVPTPGGWVAPRGVLPAWNWTPPSGLTRRWERMPRWVRAWARTPFVDRYAYAWMWYRGGWDVDPVDGPDTSGVREPRRPGTPPRAARAERTPPA